MKLVYGSPSSCLMPREMRSFSTSMSEHHGLDFVALLEAADGFFAGHDPGQVGQVNQAVDAAFQADEHAEVGDRLDRRRGPCRPSCG